jgi:hypothetical protein
VRNGAALAHGATAPLSSRSARSICLIGEADALRRVGVRTLLDALIPGASSVTIVAVASPLEWIMRSAPFAGACLFEIEEEMTQAAADAAREAAAALPGHVLVRHRVARCWSNALVLAADYDLSVVTGTPRCRRDRRRVVRVIRASSVAAVAA